MASTPPPDQGSSETTFDTTVGVLYITAVCSMGLWGAATLQMYHYYNNYQSDSGWLKTYIFAVWFLDTLHQTLLVASDYRYLIIGFGDFTQLMQIDILFVIALLVGGLICAMVQFIFLMRVWKLSEKNIILSGTISLLIVGQLVATCLYFVKALQYEDFGRLKGYMSLTRIVDAVNATADTAIALCLVVLLHRNRSGFKDSDTTINRLIVFVVNTGLVTGLCAILGLILGIVLENTLFFMLFYLMTGRLYVNSLFASLNSRKDFRNSLVKARSSFGLSNVSTGQFRTVSFQTHYNECAANTPVTPDQRPDSKPNFVTENNPTRISVTVERVVGSPFDEESRYSFDLEDPEKESNASIHSKFENIPL
ncbi:uncharacterized protein FOMMEDRAFT_149763 [Fomitiporia mediterranea MF3/22]|uniref:uncharacterized protein n=1 Tax=Fomitiporia mediterranea (strain MF3/22) TaxID=694068 RepID=UPI000440852C|nr:uncharacterized protein FOMMEDRAFT_149763 [Fomitiporia mediterranea MF3/22]EJD07252.1 hypothetical protein FOMMEDRAFT_149763 [Fomitiporia mediterranea MF3/22]